MTALELLQDSPDLDVPEPAAIPLLAPLQAHDEPALAVEIEARLAEGWRTLKVKVGFDGDHDLERVRFIQAQVAGRGVLGSMPIRPSRRRMGSVRDQPAAGGIELFEQPCSMYDWAANAACRRRSTCP